MSDNVSKSWFCTFNNPATHGYTGEPDEICNAVADAWLKHRPAGTCAVIYCISANGLHHLHAVFEDSKAMRFKAIKDVFPDMHIEPTKGNKAQAEDYILKRGKFAEKGEQVIFTARRGEIKGAQGQRRDLEILQDLIEQGLTPNEIMRMDIRFRRYEKLIKDCYFDKRYRETPVLRDIKVVWHIGESGSGKTYTYVKLCELHGEDYVYLMTDYDNGGLDRYCGESILFLDEFRGQIKYSVLLGMLQGYKQQFHSRYTNVIGLWNEVHISSVLPPEMVYRNMVTEDRNIDTQNQLFRRINSVVYHWKDCTGYYERDIPMAEYESYEKLLEVMASQKFVEYPSTEPLPFD